jgi:DNA-binding transcriptional LysR family regulator
MREVRANAAPAVNLRDVEMRHLQALDAVASEGSFGRAGERLGFTQSATSQQIAAFERIVGAALFDRPGGPRPVVLTPLGRVLLDHGKVVLERMRLAQEDAERLIAGDAGRLTVGTFQSVSVKILPPVIGRVRSELPGLSLRCVESESLAELMALLERGEIDLTFGVNVTPDPAVEMSHLMSDPFLLVCPCGSATGPATWVEVLESPLIGQQDMACQYLIDAQLRVHGMEPTYVFRSNDNGAVQAMVRNHLGLAILPRLAIETDDPGICVRELDPPLEPRQISLLRWRGRTLAPAAERFAAIASEVCAGLVAERDSRQEQLAAR